MTKERSQKEGNGNQSQAMTKKGDQGTALARSDEWLPSVFNRRPFAFMRRFGEEMDRLFADFGLGRDWLTPSFGQSLRRIWQYRLVAAGRNV